jgi:hypothetical protein
MNTTATSLPEPTKYEPLSLAQLQSLQRSVTPVQAMVLRVMDVDATRGTGVLDPKSKCVWTKDGHRITFGLISGGGFVASISNEPDPLAELVNRSVGS